MKDLPSFPIYRTGIGQDSHAFLREGTTKPCIIGGVIFEDENGFSADSDGDVVLHAICNSITSLTRAPILGKIAKDLCLKEGITDSQVYVERALKTLGSQKIVHVAIAIEGKRPHFNEKISKMSEKIASILKINIDQVGISITSGDGLTDFGCGDGVQCFCIITTVEIPSKQIH